MTLWDRWCDLWKRLQASGDLQERQARYQHLADLYSQPGRAYHTFAHIEACFTEFDAVRHISTHPDEVDYAIWFHDVICDVRRLDSEEESARLACDVAAEIGLPTLFVERVHRLILATKHEGLPADLDVDAQLLVDCDLAGLGYSFEEFRENGMRVRQEYAAAGIEDENEYEKNQAALFRRFLDRPSIFCTEYFRSKYEQRARSNLRRVLSLP
ncbi:MAG: N-methyl-D-aspartate receptor NMDAR2C subunit [Phycisphaerae bacterium]|nr:N-methyl-D-aspartate receptor NMDAR2C subunit [Phycisphaerae bacterium]